MLLISGSYYDNSDIDEPNYSKSLIVTSASHYILHTKAKFGTVRKEGRRDWHLVYIKSGKLYYNLKDEEYICTKNSILIFPPGVTLKYYFDLSDNPDIFTINFTGNKVNDFLTSKGFSFLEPIYVSQSANYTSIAESIIFELQQKNYDYLSVAALYFKLLLAQFTRSFQISQDKSSINDVVANAMLKMNSAIDKPFDISEFSDSYGISSNWFTRIFKNQIGMSPHQYLINIRIERAKSLIKSDMPIQEISAMVGYEDSLYFSRLFKKITGTAPTDYRKQQLKLLSTKPNMLSWTFTSSYSDIENLINKNKNSKK